MTAHSDREMLTWLIVNDASFGTVGRLVEVAAGVPVWSEARFVRRPCRHMYEWHCFDGADERAAIAAAMEAPLCGEDDVHGCTQSRTSREDLADSPMALLRAQNAQLLAALYGRSPTADALRTAVQAKIDAAGFLTDASRAAYALRALLDDIVGTVAS